MSENHHIRKVVASGVQLGNDGAVALLGSLSGHPSLKVCFFFFFLNLFFVLRLTFLFLLPSPKKQIIIQTTMK